MTSRSDLEGAPYRLLEAIAAMEGAALGPHQAGAYQVILDELAYYRRMSLNLERILHDLIKSGEKAERVPGMSCATCARFGLSECELWDASAMEDVCGAFKRKGAG